MDIANPSVNLHKAWICEGLLFWQLLSSCIQLLPWEFVNRKPWQDIKEKHKSQIITSYSLCNTRITKVLQDNNCQRSTTIYQLYQHVSTQKTVIVVEDWEKKKVFLFKEDENHAFKWENCQCERRSLPIIPCITIMWIYHCPNIAQENYLWTLMSTHYCCRWIVHNLRREPIPSFLNYFALFLPNANTNCHLSPNRGCKWT